MARKPRLHMKGGLYHVMLHGNGGYDIYFSDEDCYRLFLLLQEGVSRYGHRIHAFCLMPNHLHLAIQVADVPLSKIMQNLSFRYTRWVNQQQDRVGHLFQGRYQAILVDPDEYLADLVRYIHVNPYRAELVGDLDEYPWSSHHAYQGNEVLPWLTTDLLEQFAKRSATQKRRYLQFMREGMEEGYREDLHRGGDDDGRILGPERFIRKALKGTDGVPKKRPPALDMLVSKICKIYGVSEKELQMIGRRRDWAEARSVVAFASVVLGSSTLTEVATRFNRDVATLSTGVRRITTKLKSGTASDETLSALERLHIDYG